MKLGEMGRNYEADAAAGAAASRQQTLGGSPHGDLILCSAPTPNHPYQQPPRPHHSHPIIVETCFRGVRRQERLSPNQTVIQAINCILFNSEPIHCTTALNYSTLFSPPLLFIHIDWRKKETCTNNRWRVLN